MAKGSKKADKKISKESKAAKSVTKKATTKKSSKKKAIAPTQETVPSGIKGNQISGLSPTSEEFFNQTFDSNLHRGSRIIVPIDLQIYVIEDPNPQDVYDLTQIFDDDERNRPRQNQKQLEQGIHLHWAMPDALMTGDEVHDPDTELAEDIPLSEMFTFPSLPDRWLILRHWSLANGIPCVKAWVVESEKQTVTELTSWRKSESTVSLNALDDGIVGNGDDMGWTATYHAAKGRFTFHENPGTNISGPLSYSVTGWFNDPNSDPLMCPIETTRGEWNDMMKDLGWFYPQNEIVEAVNSKNQTQIVGKEVAGVKGIPTFRG